MLAQDTNSVDLRGMAAFQAGDDPIWRSKYIDEEQSWNFIEVPSPWENQGYPLLDGFAWYRIRFRIPGSMRGDSLVLVLSGIDDADECYLNGVMIGKSGDFPPNQQSELRSFRAYPIPQIIQEEYNLLAIRVFDFGDNGGLTGNLMRIIRVSDIPKVLDEVVAEPYRAPNLYTSNGVAVSAYNPITATVEWMKPHLFTELDEGLQTESILNSLTLSVALDGYVHRLKDYEIDFTEYYQNTNIIRTVFTAGFEVLWYHPQGLGQRVLVGLLRHPRGINIDDVGALFTVNKDYWQFRDYIEELDLERRFYFVFVHNSCCEELAVRDLTDIVGPDNNKNLEAISLERELVTWKEKSKRMFRPPPNLSAEELSVYFQSLSMISSAQVQEAGTGEGQIVSAMDPPSRAYTVPREHFNSVQALAAAGLVEEALKGMKFIENASVGKYMFFDVYGEEFGTGLPYIVTPARYYGSGMEYSWKKPENAILSYDGMAHYIETIQSLQDATRNIFKGENSEFNDSLFVSTYWNNLSRFAADVLMHARNEDGLIKQDGGPFGAGLERMPGIYTSIHASSALHIAAGYAKLMKDHNRHTAYEQASLQIRRTLDSIVRFTASQIEESALTVIDKNLFHPLLIDGITFGVFPPRSPASRFALEMMEHGFRIEDEQFLYNAQPDGDWFARQARPFLTLRLARAFAAEMRLTKAEDLFASITKLALGHYGMIPEFIDPVSGNWYGAVPAVAFGAAEYVLTAHAISRLRTLQLSKE
jgi:hypothetical protein